LLLEVAVWLSLFPKPLKSLANCNAHQSSAAKQLNVSNSFLYVIDCLKLFIEKRQAVASVGGCFVCPLVAFLCLRAKFWQDL
jgi:hypothetical protein